MTVLDDLLAAADQQQILDEEVLPEFVTQGVRTTDWAVGDVARADAYLAARLRQLSKDQIKVLAATRFGDYLWGYVPLPDATTEQQADLLAWAPIVAEQCFGVVPIEATYTKRRIVLTNSTANTYNKAAGRIIIVLDGGNKYVNDEAYVSAGNDAIDVIFRSEFTVSDSNTYADSVDATITFLTADLPGVTATNPAEKYTAVTRSGSGLGTITPSNTPNGVHSMAIRIDTGGHANVAAGSWSYSIDGGSFGGGAALDNVSDVAGLSVDLTFDDNGGYFIAGDVYYFSWPGTDVTQVGRSAETPQEIGLRVRAQQPLLAITRDEAGVPLPISPTVTAYQALVLQAFTEVKLCLVKTSSTINNALTVYVAGQGSVLSAATIASVSNFLQSLGAISDNITVASPATQAITLAAATVKVKSAQATAAKAEAHRRVSAYLAGVDTVAPLPIAGLVDRSYIISLIRTTPGVTYVDDALTINTFATDYQLASGTMATYSGNVGTSLTWTTV